MNPLNSPEVSNFDKQEAPRKKFSELGTGQKIGITFLTVLILLLIIVFGSIWVTASSTKKYAPIGGSEIAAMYFIDAGFKSLRGAAIISGSMYPRNIAKTISYLNKMQMQAHYIYYKQTPNYKKTNLTFNKWFNAVKHNKNLNRIGVLSPRRSVALAKIIRLNPKTPQ